MKLGVAYNFFDGEEILPYSIRSIRDQVDYICLIYQETSNWGNQITKEALSTIGHLKAVHLINEIIHFKPQLGLEAAANETRKRNIGLEACKRNKCTHYLCMDADELYFKDQFTTAKREMDTSNQVASFCTFVNYFKKPTYQAVDKRPMILTTKSAGVRTSIPFIFKIIPKLKHVLRGYNVGFELTIDPTRMLLPMRRYRRFTPNELLMQHMSWVRKDIRSKVLNSSCRANKAFANSMKQAIRLFSNWEPGGKMPFAPREIREVDNYFNIVL